MARSAPTAVVDSAREDGRRMDRGPISPIARGVAMERRRIRLGLGLICASVLAGSGCDSFHRQAVRPRTEVAGEIDTDLPDGQPIRDLHKAGLTPGTWSSEAQEPEAAS
jgi:hypothetical protein